MLNEIIEYFNFFGKIVLFGLIVIIIITAINNHKKPKIIVHEVPYTFIFNLVIILFYAVSGILSNFSVWLVILLIFHIMDIIHSYIKHGKLEVTIYNAFKSIPVMILYFIILYLNNYWSPMLRF
jgi:hypothetical protein